jgi:hypothetical protein
MATDHGQRKPAAILAPDVAGHSRRNADDDRKTVRNGARMFHIGLLG